MGGQAEEELLNVYDAAGRVTGALPRREAKRSGLAVGAVNALIVNARGELLMQRRPVAKENGGLWDKSVGGHVSAGESFDETLVREAGEELFDDPRAVQVRLVADGDAPEAAGFDLARGVLLRPVERRFNLRDVRHAPGGGLRRVLYHLAIYAGRTELPLSGFRPQASEITELRYVPADDVDAMLLAGRLAPNMAFLWLTQAHALLGR
ncbi:MAG TPA: NUDIX domain-containing protein [Vicinamibacteria bacterium]|nr:NUDIX domain-containing protein [Vicinamibacteria bacterium]